MFHMGKDCLHRFSSALQNNYNYRDYHVVFYLWDSKWVIASGFTTPSVEIWLAWLGECSVRASCQASANACPFHILRT